MANHDPYAALRYPDFRRLILAYSTTTVAREAQIVVVGWQVFAVTNDPLSLGLIGLSEHCRSSRSRSTPGTSRIA